MTSKEIAVNSINQCLTYCQLCIAANDNNIKIVCADSIIEPHELNKLAENINVAVGAANELNKNELNNE